MKDHFLKSVQTRNQGLYYVILSALGPSRLARIMWQYPSIFVVSEVTQEAKGPWRAPCQLKYPFKGQRLRWGSCWKEQKRTNNILPHEESLICHADWWYLTFEKPKNRVRGQTWSRGRTPHKPNKVCRAILSSWFPFLCKYQITNSLVCCGEI